MEAKAQEILTFWIGDAAKSPEAAAQQGALWWDSSPEFDEEIRQKFRKSYDEAIDGKLEGWKDEPRSRLAYLILLDQFPRNMFRKSPMAFASDWEAQRTCLEGLSKSMDLSLSLVERQFFYMPLEHSENLDDQMLAVRMMESIHYDAPEAWKDWAKNIVDYAQQHLVIIERFGRFPHRNATLDREPTEQETAYLKDGGANFGQ